MFDEDQETMLDRIEEFAAMDAGICRMLAGACLLLESEETAIELLHRVREHISITDDSDRMFEVDYYLDYVKNLVEITEGIKGPGPANRLRESIQDAYEVFLYNRGLLQGVLEGRKKEDDLDGFRRNYYLN